MVIGTVAEGPLEGWEIVSTGDGRAITMKSGSCWGQVADGERVEPDLAWTAVSARLFLRMSDTDLVCRIAEVADEIKKRASAGLSTLGSEAGLRVLRDELARRKGEQ